MATPQQKAAPDPAALATKVQDLRFTRERFRALSQRFPQLEAAVRNAAELVERTKLEADLRPAQSVSREAENAAHKLDLAVIERDELVASIERLRRHESALAAEVAALEDVDLAASRAAARAANAAAIRSEAPAVRRWAARIQIDAENAGIQVADPGRLLVDYLTGEFRNSGLTGLQTALREVYAEAAGIRAAIERGEVIS